MTLAFAGGPGWSRFCRLASEISLLSCTAVSVQWPHRALACRLFPFHPARPLMTSTTDPDNWGRKGREVELWPVERGVGVRGQWEEKEVGGLASQGDDEGECVWSGKWVAGICVSFGTTSFCMHISRKMWPILPHSPAACVKQVSWLAQHVKLHGMCLLCVAWHCPWPAHLWPMISSTLNTSQRQHFIAVERNWPKTSRYKALKNNQDLYWHILPEIKLATLKFLPEAHNHKKVYPVWEALSLTHIQTQSENRSCHGTMWWNREVCLRLFLPWPLSWHYGMAGQSKQLLLLSAKWLLDSNRVWHLGQSCREGVVCVCERNDRDIESTWGLQGWCVCVFVCVCVCLCLCLKKRESIKRKKWQQTDECDIAGDWLQACGQVSCPTHSGVC